MLNSFSEEQLEIIKKTLESCIVDDICIPKKILFECINEKYPLHMEQYQFELLLTQAIRSNTLRGFAIKQGRGGGICRSDNLKKSCTNKSVSVTFNGNTFKVPSSKKRILNSILKSSTEAKDGEGNFFVNNRLYCIPEKIDTLKFLEQYFKSNQ